MSDFLRFTSEQSFEWGSIRWYFEPDDMDTDRLSVAIATYLPAGVQPMHAHYREEQVLYVISGVGVHSMNGKTEYLRPGCIVHLPSYSEHGLSNFSAYEELKVLLVYSPSRFLTLIGQTQRSLAANGPEHLAVSPEVELELWAEAKRQVQHQDRTGAGPTPCSESRSEPGPATQAAAGRQGSGRAEEPGLSRPLQEDVRPAGAGDAAFGSLFDAEAVSSIRATMERLSQALGLSLALLDAGGRCIFKTANHPRLCCALAHFAGGSFCQLQMKEQLDSLAGMPRENLQKPHFFTCCNRIASTIIPVVYDGGIQAYMKCGEIF